MRLVPMMMMMTAALVAAACDKDDGTAGWKIAQSSDQDATTSEDTGAASGDDTSGGATDTGPSGASDTAQDVAAADGDAADGDTAMDGATLDAVAGDATPEDAADGVDAADAEHPHDVATGDAAATCEPTVTFQANPGTSHVTEPPTYSSYPPAAGDHYAILSAWGVAKGFVPAGNWVHNLEHGGIVFLYRCDTPCPALAAELHAVVDSLPADAACDGIPDVDNRVVLTEDPCLPDGVTVAAIAWEWVYEATCVDAASLKQFVANHQGQAPEDSCGQGTFVASPEDPPPTCPTIVP